MKRLWWLFCLTSTCASCAWAGDAHYWTNQFGTKSDLLSGQVIGALGDASQAYYNPGALGLLKDRSLVLSGSAFEYATIQVGQGDKEKLQTTNAGLLPNFLAGTLPFRGPDGQTLSYSVFTRQTFDANLVRRLQTQVDVLPESPGAEDFNGKNSFEQHLSESWIGVTWARPVTDHVGIGVTEYFAYRSQKARFETFASAFNQSTSQLASFSTFREGDYNALRTLFKPGILVDLKPVLFGITFETPGIRIYGSGNAYTYTSRAGIDANGDGAPDPLFSSSFQEGIKAQYKSPWSVGLGASVEAHRTTYYASAQWYDAVRAFDVLETSSYQSQSDGTLVTPHIQQALKAVWNYGAGVEHRFTEKISAYGSFSTDRSALDAASDVSFAPWNTIEFLGGTAFKFRKMSITLGMGYGYGSGQTKPNADFQNVSEANDLLGGRTPTDIKYRRLKFIFGFTIELPPTENTKERPAP